MKSAKPHYNVIFIGFTMLIITGALYLTEGRWAAAPVLRYLYLVPIAQSALAFGTSGSMTVAILADLLFAPLIATAYKKYGLYGVPTVEILMTLLLLPVLAYFAGSGWGRLSRQRELYVFLSRMGDLFGRSLPQRDLLNQILAEGAQLIEADAGEVILLRDDDAMIAASLGFNFTATLDYDQSLARWIIDRNQPWHTASLENDSQFMRVGKGARIDSAIAVPLRIEGKPVGLLAFYNRAGGFGKHELAVVAAIGSKVEVVLENQRQLRERDERERLQREFALAAQVQQQFLPTSIPDINGYELAAYVHSAREIGGDFYSVNNLADGRWCIAVGDVSGKGVVAAFFMAIATSVIDLHLRDTTANIKLPLAQRLNGLFHARMHTQGINTALCYMILDPILGELRIGNAGLIAPILVTTSGEVQYLDVVGLPLGSIRDAKYTESCMQLGHGETLILVSDGIVEAHDGTRELLGFEGVQEFIQEKHTITTSDLAAHLLDYAQIWSNGHIHDDMTVLVLRRV